MQSTPINSRALASLAYDADTGLLRIQFRDGRSYEYANIPADVHAALLSTESPGRYFNAVIRARFPYRATPDSGFGGV